jgi:hypothetical protein
VDFKRKSYGNTYARLCQLSRHKGEVDDADCSDLGYAAAIIPIS